MSSIINLLVPSPRKEIDNNYIHKNTKKELNENITQGMTEQCIHELTKKLCLVYRSAINNT
jgi:hypothetical protein